MLGTVTELARLLPLALEDGVGPVDVEVRGEEPADRLDFDLDLGDDAAPAQVREMMEGVPDGGPLALDLLGEAGDRFRAGLHDRQGALCFAARSSTWRSVSANSA